MEPKAGLARLSLSADLVLSPLIIEISSSIRLGCEVLPISLFTSSTKLVGPLVCYNSLLTWRGAGEQPTLLVPMIWERAQNRKVGLHIEWVPTPLSDPSLFYRYDRRYPTANLVSNRPTLHPLSVFIRRKSTGSVSCTEGRILPHRSVWEEIQTEYNSETS